MKYFVLLFSLLWLFGSGCNPKQRDQDQNKRAAEKIQGQSQNDSERSKNPKNVQSHKNSAYKNLQVLRSLAPFLSNDLKALVLLDLSTPKKLFDMVYFILGSHLSHAQRQAFEKDLFQYFYHHFGVDLSGVQWVAIAIAGQNKLGLFMGGNLPDLSSLQSHKLGAFDVFELRSKELSLVKLQDQKIYGIIALGQKQYFESLDLDLAWKTLSPELVALLNRFHAQSSTLLFIAHLSKVSPRDLPPQIKAALKDMHWAGIVLHREIEIAIQGPEQSIEAFKTQFSGFKTLMLQSLKPKVDHPSRDMNIKDALHILGTQYLIPPLAETLTPTFDPTMAYLSIHSPFPPEALLLTLSGSATFVGMSLFQKVETDTHTQAVNLKLYSLKRATKTYRKKHQKLPESLDLLIQDQLLKEIPKDPWGNQYFLELYENGQKCRIYSSGPDKIPHTSDDLAITF